MTDISVTTEPPIFVLCNARSGSTLLRFLLDAHPDLACPPETNLPALCAQLATVWSLIEGAPLSPDRGAEPPEVPDAAIDGIRHTVELMTSSYLGRRASTRFCDKSLGTARYAELLLRVYPEAKFLCLYRHPMDMIASGIEACPWGLTGYGFDSYIAGSPGNIVLALARYWADHTSAILAAEEQFPQSCHRVRYEDLVTDPARTADEMFKFIGVPSAPDVTEHCFTEDRERSGPGDFKIWHTSRISRDSIGRGWTIPVTRIPSPITDQLNELAEKLGYLQVDGGWGTTLAPADVRVDCEPAAARTETDRASDTDGPGATLLRQRLSAAIAGLDGAFTRRWGPHADAPFGIVVSPGTDGGELRLRIDLPTRSITRSADDADDGTEWDVLGSDRMWEDVLGGGANLGVALRANALRYCDTGDGGRPFAAESRIDLLSDLLGLATWPSTRQSQTRQDGERQQEGVVQ